MPKFYCEYCSIYLTHSSPGGRKQHSQGRKHINAKVDYYQKLVREQFFQPPSFLNQQIPVFGGFPMMGMIPGFHGFQPNNMVKKMDSNHLLLPPQGMIPPIPGSIPPGVPTPVPSSITQPITPTVSGTVPGSIPLPPLGVPSIPSNLPVNKPDVSLEPSSNGSNKNPLT